jgi:hypothetical protein
VIDAVRYVGQRYPLLRILFILKKECGTITLIGTMPLQKKLPALPHPIRVIGLGSFDNNSRNNGPNESRRTVL